MKELFSTISYAEVDREDWEKAGNLLRKLRRRGVTVPLSDAIIAVVARKHGYAILTLDRHFDHLEVPLHPTKNQ
ncbi:MAG: PIN domain-containing protein [Thermodesulfobacteriota bacterium]|nr:PIN domain-containing protein [Thermodesulfobacteriota bacterium]